MRKSARKILLSSAIFASHGMAFQFMSTLDLSTGGISLVLPMPLQIGQLCATSFDVPARRSWQRTLACGRVRSCVEMGINDYRIGIHFIQADAISVSLIREAIERYLRS
ncbi:MAG: PilZ domain-containing protein [Burkholderiales bacterium]|nr:PilZ domain-containing protein [Burkholderiales bacterium]